MGASATHCIPKAEVHEEAVPAVWAAKTRPPSMMHTSSKIVALAANRYLGGVAQRTVAGKQRGFVRDRRMETNVLEIGVGLIEASVVAQRTASAILLGFSAVFPNLKHR